MAHLFSQERVRLLCSCGLLKSIVWAYFCRHCFKLRCGNCLRHEVDTLFCPSCMENMAQIEASQKKNRCANCYDCPSCLQTLATRVTNIPANPDDPLSTPRKRYYLGCQICRWTSRDAGLEDQLVASGGWQERDNPYSKRIQELTEYYRTLGQREKFELEKKKTPKKRSTYLTPSAKVRLSSYFGSLSSRKSPACSTLFAKAEPSFACEIGPSIPVEDVPGLPEGIFTEDINLNEVTNLSQRLHCPESQPERACDLRPIYKHIVVKRGQRCLVCDHGLSKPEYNPASVKFKIQMGAYYHVPEVKIMKEVELKWGVETTVQLSLCNPTPHDMKVALLPFVPDAYMEEESEDAPEFSSPSSTGSSLPRVVPKPREYALKKISFTHDVRLPQGEMILAARDDTAEYDDIEAEGNFNDDPQVVAWRGANKVGVDVHVKPEQGAKEAIFGMVLRYEYTNTVVTTSAPRTFTMNIPVVINAGKVVE